jgi:cytochrome P450
VINKVQTVIGMTIRQLHWNKENFPEPLQYKPERWLGESKKRLQKYFVPFGKGSRSCVGINLAWAELYVTIGNIIRKFDMELYDTTSEQVAVFRDSFKPASRPGSHGVWIKVKGVNSF